MPNKDSTTGIVYTLYYISVTNIKTNQTYVVNKRYSEFHQLYLSIYSNLVNAFHNGMQNLFPDNRSSTWLTKETDQLRNARREYLDAWIKEAINNAILMLDLKARDKIYNFLEFNKNFNNILVYKR